MSEKKKYLDQSRFPKVVTNGYELEFKQNYDLTLKDMLKGVITKVVEINKKNNEKWKQFINLG